MTLQWLACDLRTGDVLADLATFEADYPLRRTIGAYDTAGGKLWLDGAPDDWERAVLEGGAVLHVYDDEDPLQTPLWSGWVVEAARDSDEDAVEVALATAEAYLDRRYVGDVTYTAKGQNAIVADLIARYVADGAQPGLPITTAKLDGEGTPRDRTYLDIDNATVYTRLQQLRGVAGGPEWTIEWAWTGNRRGIVPRLEVGTRIGTAPAAGLAPAASFEMPGCMVSVRQVRSYAAGRGANDVQAYSGDVRSAHYRATNYGGRPTFEYRWQPSSSISKVATLNGHASAGRTVLAPGARTLAVVANLEDAPRLGADWRLGDDVACHVEAGEVAPFPSGLDGNGRVIAYELGESTVALILAEAEVYTEGA